VNDYVAVLEEIKPVNQVAGVELVGEDVAVKAKVKIEGEHESFYAEPIFLIHNKSEVGRNTFRDQ